MCSTLEDINVGNGAVVTFLDLQNAAAREFERIEVDQRQNNTRALNVLQYTEEKRLLKMNDELIFPDFISLVISHLPHYRVLYRNGESQQKCSIHQIDECQMMAVLNLLILTIRGYVTLGYDC